MRYAALYGLPSARCSSAWTLADYDVMANNHDLVVLTGDDRTVGDTAYYMSAKGCEVYFYTNTQAVVSGWRSHTIASTSGWILTGAGGTIATETGAPANVLNDLTDADCRALKISLASAYYGPLAGGVFWDVACSWLYPSYYNVVPIDPATSSAMTSSGMYVMMKDFVAQNAAVAEGKYRNMINGIGWDRGYQYFAQSSGQSSAFTPSGTRFLIESFTRGYSTAIDTFKAEGSDHTADTWMSDVDMLIELGDKAVTLSSVEVAATEAELKQWGDYCLGSYCLGATTGAHFSFRHWVNGTKTYWPYVTRALNKLGDPDESFTYISGAKARLSGGPNTYHREFTSGIVLVNPTTTDDPKVCLNDFYFDDDSNLVDTAAMPAHTGRILLVAPHQSKGRITGP